MEFGMSRRIKPKVKFVRISVRRKNKQLWSYVVSFEFSWQKVALPRDAVYILLFEFTAFLIPVVEHWLEREIA